MVLLNEDVAPHIERLNEISEPLPFVLLGPHSLTIKRGGRFSKRPVPGSTQLVFHSVYEGRRAVIFRFTGHRSEDRLGIPGDWVELRLGDAVEWLNGFKDWLEGALGDAALGVIDKAREDKQLEQGAAAYGELFGSW